MSVDPVLATTYQSRRTLAACRAGAVLPAAYRPNTSNDDRSVGRDLDVIGLTTNGRLVRFDAADPVRGRDLGRVKGLVGDASLVGIDYRVQDGKLYGVGDQGGIYTISTRGAVATMVSRLTVDTAQDQVAIQSPANNGTLAPTGKLLVDVGPTAGFDIYSRLRAGRTVSNAAYAALPIGGRSAFFRVNLLAGQAEPVGFFSSRNQVVDIAIPLNQR